MHFGVGIVFHLSLVSRLFMDSLFPLRKLRDKATDTLFLSFNSQENIRSSRYEYFGLIVSGQNTKSLFDGPKSTKTYDWVIERSSMINFPRVLKISWPLTRGIDISVIRDGVV